VPCSEEDMALCMGFVLSLSEADFLQDGSDLGYSDVMILRAVTGREWISEGVYDVSRRLAYGQ